MPVCLLRRNDLTIPSKPQQQETTSQPMGLALHSHPSNIAMGPRDRHGDMAPLLKGTAGEAGAGEDGSAVSIPLLGTEFLHLV